MSNSNIVLPDGDHVVDIINIERRTNSQGKKTVEWTLRAVNEPYAGVEFIKKYYLTNEKVMQFLIKELEIVGVTARNGEELDRERIKAIGRRIIITVVTNEASGFQTYYITNKLPASQSSVQSSMISSW